MIKLSKNLTTKKEKLDFIRECEDNFRIQLNDACEKIIADGTKIIALSGPTCSGKTTTAAKLTAELTAKGFEVHLISIDNFFKERDVLDKEAIMKNGSIDYDSVNAIDLGLLSERVASIIKGDPTELPVYDFVTGKCTHFELVDPNDHSVFIFEGIQAIYPEVTALFGENYKSLYISVENDFEINDIFFNKRELRLMRRLIRDYKFRAASPEFTFFLWRSVAANEDKSIIPYADTADIRINSFMAYEVFLMSGLLPELLSLVPKGNPHYPRALELSQRLNRLGSIAGELVPTDSLLREFIG